MELCFNAKSLVDIYRRKTSDVHTRQFVRTSGEISSAVVYGIDLT